MFVIESDEVGAFAGFDRAANIFEAKEFGGIRRSHASEVNIRDAEGVQ